LTRIINDRLRSADAIGRCAAGQGKSSGGARRCDASAVGRRKPAQRDGAGGFAMVRERFTWRAVALRYLQIYAASV
jgi:hypothetical protein